MASSPSRRTSGLPRRLSTLAVLAAVLLTSCSQEAPGTASDEVAPSGSTGAAPSAPAAPTEPTEPTVSGTPTAAPPAAPPALGRRADALKPRLLTADQLPPLTPRTDWRGAGVSTGEQEDFALCHPFSLTAAGAEQVTARRFVAADAPDAGTPRAGHLLAHFPDARTTRRAGAVLEAWHEQCEERLAEDAHRARVGDRVAVEGLPGPASWYRTKLRRQAGATPVVELTGTVRVGSRIGVVVVRHRKDDVSPGAGRRQVVRALQRAAAALT